MQTDVRPRTKSNPLGAGRSPRAEKPADERLTIRLTALERAAYEAAAADAEQTVGDWIRSACAARLAREHTARTAKRGRRS